MSRRRAKRALQRWIAYRIRHCAVSGPGGLTVYDTPMTAGERTAYRRHVRETDRLYLARNTCRPGMRYPCGDFHHNGHCVRPTPPSTHPSQGDQR